MKFSNFWITYFRPSVFIKKITDINVYALKQSGIKYVFCDLDNTLIPHFTHLPNTQSSLFINSLKNNGMKIIVVSNNKKSRVEQFCDLVPVDDFIYNAKKPMLKKMKKIIKKYNIHLEDSIIIGDQFITDILLANRLGIKSILLLPLVDSANETIKNLLISILDKLIYKHLFVDSSLQDIWNGESKKDYDII